MVFGEFCDLIWDHNVKSVIITWKKVPKEIDFHNCLTEGLMLFKKIESKKWICDRSLVEDFGIEEQNWMQNVWFPKIIKAGLKYYGIVLPHHSDMKLTAHDLLDVLELNLLTEYFDDLKGAKGWIVKFS